jgi:hypothetical protein
MKWIKPSDKLPPQGKKILYFLDGDLYVVQRFGMHWLPIPFADSKYGHFAPPKYWSDITPPEGLTGKMIVSVDNDLFDIDELEIAHHYFYVRLVESISKEFRKGSNLNG